MTKKEHTTITELFQSWTCWKAWTCSFGWMEAGEWMSVRTANPLA